MIHSHGPDRVALYAASLAGVLWASKAYQPSVVKILSTVAACALLAVCVLMAALDDLVGTVQEYFDPPKPAMIAEEKQFDEEFDGPMITPRNIGRGVCVSDEVSDHCIHAGFNCERHVVETSDGYLLVVHRIRPQMLTMGDVMAGPSGIQAAPTGAPIILQHGLLQRDGVFVAASGSESFAFLLARRGYDVWLGTTRGTYPMHKTLSIDSEEFWDYGLTEIGAHDFPAIIRYVARSTGQKPIFVGHSQGAAMGMIGFAENPEISKEVRMFAALAPAFYVKPPMHFVVGKLLANAQTNLLSTLFGRHSFLPIMVFVQKILPAPLFMYFGSRMFSYLFGWRHDRFDSRFMKATFRFTPTNVSTRLIGQWMASMRSGQLVRLGKDMSDGAPFEVPKLECPVAVVWGGEDDICDGEMLADALEASSPGQVRWKIHVPEYSHLDVIWASDCGKSVAEPLAQAFDQVVQESQ